MRHSNPVFHKVESVQEHILRLLIDLYAQGFQDSSRDVPSTPLRRKGLQRLNNRVRRSADGEQLLNTSA